VADNPDLLCVRGKGLYGTGQLEAALKHFAEALRQVCGPETSSAPVACAHHPGHLPHMRQDPDHTAAKRMRSKLKELERIRKGGNEAFSAGRSATGSFDFGRWAI